VATGWYLSHAQKAEAVPARVTLDHLPLTIGNWHGRNMEPFSSQILALLGVDDYITRTYWRPHEDAVGLYVGFYESQRQGDSIHSPLNCLPGAGWTPVSQQRMAITVHDPALNANRDIVVNRFVIQKGLDRQIVLYWYQSHGRIVASEYWGKVYTVVDAVRLNRTDAALVRVTSPIGDEPGSGDAGARAVSFVQTIYPLLAPHLPK
jgi:EpsI family protein